MNSMVIHYNEIALKGKNRGFFEKLLKTNIEKILGNQITKIYKRYGRLVCNLNEDSDIDIINVSLEKMPGIAYFSFVTKSGLDMNEIKKKSLETLKREKFRTFKVVTKRSNKNFGKTSQELNAILGETIIKGLNKKVDVKTPEVRLHVEICEKEAFIYCNKHRGIGGLPVGSSGKVIASLSGGLDSPVASYLLMKRGCNVVFVHIYNDTVAGTSVLTKINSIVKQLTKSQINSKLYIIPFGKIQREIIASVLAKYRMIVYRRFMMRIINTIAAKENAKGIVTGDSVGQVASQTLENLQCIHGASELPVFAPLIGMNKEEIIDISKSIGTFDYSIMKGADCCSYMIAQHPETRADLERIEQIEKHISGQENLIENSVRKAEVKIFKF